MKRNYRQGRLAEEIKKIISDMLLRELKDPRLSGLVSIAEVKAAKDGGFATVYITVLGKNPTESASDKEKEDVINAFNNAKGLIRKEIGSQLKLRHTPDLSFKIDTVEEYGRHIDQLIDSLVIKDGE